MQAGDEDEPDVEAVQSSTPASPARQGDTGRDDTRHVRCTGEGNGHGAGTVEAAAAAPAAAETARLDLLQGQVQIMTVAYFPNCS